MSVKFPEDSSKGNVSPVENSLFVCVGCFHRVGSLTYDAKMNILALQEC